VRALLAQAVRIDVRPDPARGGATTFDVSVRVTNLSGHKFPTGYADGRRAFLQVELTDGQGRSLGLLGRYDEATARLDPATELRVWESVQAEHLPGGGHHEWHIAKNDTIVKDTRIPPLGFRPEGAAAIAMTAPVGADYGPVTGMRNHDQVAVRFTGLQPLAAGTVRVTARVFYQSTTRELIEELARANTTDDRGARLVAIWEQTGRAAPRLIASQSAEVTVDVSPPAGDAGCGCGVGGDPGGAGALLLGLAVLASTRPRLRRRT
jgi:MYXO-CTERM domain-containing protein